MDKRIVFYYPFYFIGLLITSPTMLLSFVKNKYLFPFLLSFLTCVYLSRRWDNLDEHWTVSYVMSVSFIYVFLYFSKMMAYWSSHKKYVVSFFTFLSISSMCAYLFHRQIYYLFGLFWEGGYYIGAFIIFPLSYLIQKVYDYCYRIMSHVLVLNKRKV